jgi:asparagine synthase (glutamine-hydrolysing)
VYSRFAAPDGDAVATGARCELGYGALQTSRDEHEQPMTLDGRVWISADVRLDDREGLLALLGDRVAAGTRSDDAALVLLAYARWGDRFLEHLAGEFAFALWDPSRNRLICARDQIGVAPLHYSLVGDQLLVSSSLDALFLHLGVSDRLNESAIADFLLFGRAESFGATAFQSIRRLAPGHRLDWAPNGLLVQRYWRQPEYAPLLRLRRPESYVAHFGHLLERAVADRSTSETVSVQLSGGMDSTAVAAMARIANTRSGRATENVRAITAVLGGSSGDREGDYAALVAKHLNIALEIADDSQLPVTDPLAGTAFVTPEPTPYRWTELEYRVAAAAAEHSRICLSGLGGDPVMAHVPWFWAQWLRDGHPLRLALALTDHVRLFKQRPHPHLRQTAQSMWQLRRVPSPDVPPWLQRDLAVRASAAGRLRRMSQQPTRSWDKRSLTHDPVWHTWFTWGDPTFTRLPMRVRHPFIDLRLLEFAARVPPDPWFANKWILRQATAGLLPTQVRSRPKTPLVDAGRAGMTHAARARLVELIDAVPEAGRFLDLGALADAIRDPGKPRQNLALSPPFGLLIWLYYRSRPQGHFLGRSLGLRNLNME